MSEIAVIIPTYSRATSLKRAIESVLAQSLPDIEMIVVDDGSEDDTQDVVQSYRTCRYLKTSHSGLPAVARNIGARMTTATYLAFLDSDDEWRPSKLERQLLKISEGPYGLVCSNASLNGVRPYLQPRRKPTGRVLEDLIEENFVITSSVVVRRDLFDQVGGFCEDPLLRGLEDYDLWLRLAAATDFHYIDEELVVYTQSDASLSRTRSMLAHWKGMEFIFSRVADIGGLATILNRQVAACRSSMCDEYLSSGQYRNFAKMFASLWKRRRRAVARYVMTGRWISRGLRGILG
jgi:glycosyltransferase involved in cell wall biosynthesis